MTPRRARGGATGEFVTYALRECSLGIILVAWTTRGVCDVRFGDSEQAVISGIGARFSKAAIQREGVPGWVEAVIDSVETPMPAAVPLDIAGTAFQQRVWQELRRIPLGETRSYEEVAKAIGAPHATRAVAQACAANNLAVVVPCHRVVRSNGDVSGYRRGRKRKESLLRREAAAREQNGTRQD
jgi:AraC family transcriptional regulator of adaptative response/methylated-DNA-[protein]-cysteine methyltransferase